MGEICILFFVNVKFSYIKVVLDLKTTLLGVI